MEMKRLTVPVEVKDLNETEGTATFVASVFGNVDSSKDRVFKGFFQKSLTERLPKFVADHKWEVTHRLGKVLAAQETADGLEVTVKFNLEKQIAREVYSDFKFAPEDQEFSFGYSVKDWRPNEFGGRDLLEGTVYEVSPVLVGDNPKTRLVAVKGEDPDAEEWECEKCRGLNRRRRKDGEPEECETCLKNDAEGEDAAAGTTVDENDADGADSPTLAEARSRVTEMLDRIESLLKT